MKTIVFLSLYIVGSFYRMYGQDTAGTHFGSFTDSRDGHEYKTVLIGNRVWMAENLAYLPKVFPSSTDSNRTPAYYVYSYSGTMVSDAKGNPYYSTYGALYNWEAAKSSCPAGWHLPSDKEWKDLEKFLGMSQKDANKIGQKRNSGSVGGKLKETSGMHWKGPNTGATNASGFGALPGGIRYVNGKFLHEGILVYFWSSSKWIASGAINRTLWKDQAGVDRFATSKSIGSCVRCLRDY